ncbi:MAG: hypothetical protein ABSF26_19830 [Thermoguttaceae bacterium]
MKNESAEFDNDDVAGTGEPGQHDAGGDDAGRHGEEAHAGEVKTAELSMPGSLEYYHPPDLRGPDGTAGALRVYAGYMDDNAKVLRTIADAVAGHPVDIDVTKHFISVSGPTEVIDDLVAKGLLEACPDEDEDEVADGGEGYGSTEEE